MFKPTDQQIAIQEAFNTEKDGVVDAFAGTGKTSTLLLLAENTDRRGIIITYNKDAQKDADAKLEARGIKGRVNARTGHSLAWGFAHRNRVFSQPRVPAWKAAKILGVPAHLSIQIGEDGDSYLQDSDIARLAIQTVKRFCHSADEEIQRYHVPSVPGADAQREEIRDIVMPFAAKVWADALNPKGQLYYDHDYYLKAWALSKPVIRVQFLFLDEAQDTNPVLAQVVAAQKCQKIMVGDRYQSIYAWRGAVDAMSSFPCEWRLPLTQSFRFGQAVADEANKWLRLLGCDLEIQGNPNITSKVDALVDPHAVLCRTNATCVAEAMKGLEAGKKVALAGGTKKVAPLRSFIEAAQELTEQGHTRHPELVAFSSWEEVQKFAKEDEGADLRVWVSLIDTYGTFDLLDAVNQLGKEEGAELIVSTAHSAKGREWETVKIAPDFKAPTAEEDEEPQVSPTDAMLAYVAVTRARMVLDRLGLAWVDDFVPATA